MPGSVEKLVFLFLKWGCCVLMIPFQIWIDSFFITSGFHFSNLMKTEWWLQVVFILAIWRKQNDVCVPLLCLHGCEDQSITVLEQKGHNDVLRGEFRGKRIQNPCTIYYLSIWLWISVYITTIIWESNKFISRARKCQMT